LTNYKEKNSYHSRGHHPCDYGSWASYWCLCLSDQVYS